MKQVGKALLYSRYRVLYGYSRYRVANYNRFVKFECNDSYLCL